MGRYKRNPSQEAPYIGSAHWPRHSYTGIYMTTNARVHGLLISRVGFHRFLACESRIEATINVNPVNFRTKEGNIMSHGATSNNQHINVGG